MMSQYDGDSSNSTVSSLRKLFLRKLANASGGSDDPSVEFAKDVANCGRSEKVGTGPLFGRETDELKKWFHEKFRQTRSTSEQLSSTTDHPSTNDVSKKSPSIIKAKTQPELLLNKMLETCINFEPGLLEIEEHALFETDQAVWILGDSYNTLHDRNEIKQALRSLLWFTYRKNFAPIGGTGPTSDQGWGCMLRCGQMVLAQALIRRHLGPWWRWDPTGAKDQQYLYILRMFQDKKNQMYSIHQIAQMGVSEGKLIGEWFGPNTVAHVLKKLTVYDDWSSLAIHVAMDSVVVLEHVRTVCQTRPKHSRSVSSSSGGYHSLDVGETGSGVTSSGGPVVRLPDARQATEAERPESKFVVDGSSGLAWRPLLLIVPLRLGLANLNPVYIPAMKEFFMLKQCLGAIGGRPNHALYFVGAIGNELLYLDPHYCQPSVDLDAEKGDDIDSEQSAAADASTSRSEAFRDSSFHCPYLLHMPTANIDPSLALAFYCQTESELDDLCACFRKGLFKASDPPLFELIDRPPTCWPKFVPYAGEDAAGVNDFAVVDPHFDTDEEFEILD